MKTLNDFRASYEAIKAPELARRYLGRVRAACTQRGWQVPDWAAAQARRTTPAALPVAEPIALPAGLVAWRAGGVGRIISRDFDGKITLYDWPDGKPFYARFRDATAALEALEKGAIEWSRKNKTADSRGFVGRAVACER